ncbi:4-(cytidine 5'-diphospho)-2-C-methyl-D-erythritol kinase [Minwuia sp.]|uniref:4-(cytidine 5'-diphospho)-2-C-methyl-D-erythritol kinase n=1 Tax=Minwuia sp. TaxID=2493630 RepID=UPI003A8CF7EF
MAAVSEDTASTCTELAPAKINLFLHVVGRRDDGYHLLESLVAFASVGDRVSIEPLPGTTSSATLSVTGRFADMIGGDPGDNLAIRATAALRGMAGTSGDILVRLEKNLPVAAGVGGGSADAAATLIALNRFWNLGLDRDALAAIGLSLGADVPACLHRSAVMMQGIGEELATVPMPSGLGVVLVNPLLPLPTPAVFADFRSFGHFAPVGRFDWQSTRDRQGWLDQLGRTCNSLEPPARRLLPRISNILDTLSQTGDCLLARMSGSGATCFGLFADWQTAARRADQLSGAHPEWWVAPGRLL